MLGFVVFQYKSNARAVFGIVVALAGVIAYTELKRRMVNSGGPASSQQSSSSLPSHMRYSKVTTDEIPDDEILGRGAAGSLSSLELAQKV